MSPNSKCIRNGIILIVAILGVLLAHCEASRAGDIASWVESIGVFSNDSAFLSASDCRNLMAQYETQHEVGGTDAGEAPDGDTVWGIAYARNVDLDRPREIVVSILWRGQSRIFVIDSVTEWNIRLLSSDVQLGMGRYSTLAFASVKSHDVLYADLEPSGGSNVTTQYRKYWNLARNDSASLDLLMRSKLISCVDPVNSHVLADVLLVDSVGVTARYTYAFYATECMRDTLCHRSVPCWRTESLLDFGSFPFAEPLSRSVPGIVLRGLDTFDIPWGSTEGEYSMIRANRLTTEQVVTVVGAFRLDGFVDAWRRNLEIIAISRRGWSSRVASVLTGGVR